MSGNSEKLNAEAAAFFKQGNEHFNKKEYGAAIVAYTKATELQPDFAEAFNNRGIAYADKGDCDKAIVDCDEAIRLQPNFGLAFANRKIAYRNKGDYGKAIADYNEATRLLPDFMKANNPQAPQFPVTEKQDFAGSAFVYNISGNSNSQIIMDSPYAQINITANEENAVLKYLNELADNNKNDMALQKILQKTQTAIKEKKASEGFLRGIGSALTSFSISLASNLLTPIVAKLSGIST